MTNQQQEKAAAPIEDYTALEMAAAHIEDMGISDPEHARRVQETAALVAEYLYDTGNAFRWDRLRVTDFFTCISYLSDQEQEGVGLILMGYYVWLSTLGLVPAEVAQDILADIVRLHPDSIALGTLRRQAQRALAPLACGSLQ